MGNEASEELKTWAEEEIGKIDVTDRVMRPVTRIALSSSYNHEGLEITALAFKKEEFKIEEIAEELMLSHSTVMNTIETLTRFDLFKVRKEHRKKVFTIRKANFEKFITALKEIRKSRIEPEDNDWSKYGITPENVIKNVMQLFNSHLERSKEEKGK
jgi:DNA-binding transcriptional regulator GbsR (MarR family)